MKNRMILTVEMDRPLEKYGDRHMIVYDESTKTYYVTSRESFLKEQNDKIAELERIIKECEAKNNAFQENMDKKFSSFLQTYKETNSKLIEMVKNFTNKGE